MHNKYLFCAHLYEFMLDEHLPVQTPTIRNNAAYKAIFLRLNDDSRFISTSLGTVAEGLRFETGLTWMYVCSYVCE